MVKYTFIKERIKTLRALGYVRPKGFQFYFKDFIKYQNGQKYSTRHNISFEDMAYIKTSLFYSTLKREESFALARLSFYMNEGDGI